MIAIVFIASIIEFSNVCECSVHPPLSQCPSKNKLVYETQEFQVYQVYFKNEPRFLRVFHQEAASNKAQSYIHELRNYIRNNAVTPPTCTEEDQLFLICRDEIGRIGFVTYIYSYLRTETQVSPSGQPTPTRILQAILTGIITYNSAGFSDLRLNEENVQVAGGEYTFILTGMATRGPYRTQLQYMAPEVLLDTHQDQAHPDSDIWFAGVLYFKLLNGGSIIPYSGYGGIYGNLEGESTQKEYTLNDMTKTRLRLMTRDAWRVIFSDVEIDVGFNLVGFKNLRNRIASILQKLNGPTSLLLRGMLALFPEMRFKPEQALESVQNILQDAQQQ